jgi:hypothetical protein
MTKEETLFKRMKELEVEVSFHFLELLFLIMLFERIGGVGCLHKTQNYP